MTFVNDDEIEEVRWELFKKAFSVFVWAPEGLIDAEVYVSVKIGWVSLNEMAWVAGAGCEWRKGVVGLIAKHYAIG